MTDILVTVCLLLFCVCKTTADYTCICNRHVERTVYKNPGDTSFPIDNLYEDDCVQLMAGTTFQNWFAVVANGEVGYVLKDYEMDITSCQGSPPSLKPWTASTAGSTSQTRPATQSASTPITSTISTTSPASTASVSPTSSSSKKPVSSSAWTSLSPSTKPSTIQHTMSVATTDACPTQMGMVAAGFWASSDQWCFQFVHVLESWQVAEHMCNIQGGHLVTIENAQKEQFITSLLKAHGLLSNFWIGLNDQMREAYFQWSSGIDAHYNNFESWHSHPFADCVYLSADTGKWHESHCTIARHYYICQFNKNTYHGGPIIG